MSTQAEATPVARSVVGSHSLATRLTALLNLLATWMERRRQRLALGALNDTLLHDIGLSRADVEGEVNKPFWTI